jgi:hypothetical protein
MGKVTGRKCDLAVKRPLARFGMAMPKMRIDVAVHPYL